MTFTVVNAKFSAVETDDVADLADNGEVLEAVGVDDNLGPVVIGWFTALGVKGGIDNLEGTDVFVAGYLVGEGSIDNNTVDVYVIAAGEGNLGEFGVLVLLSLCLGNGLGWSA